MDENIKNLKILLAAMQKDHLGVGDFTKNFKKVLDFVKKIDARNIKEFERLSRELNSLAKKIDNENRESKDKLQRTLTAELESLLRRFSAKSTELDVKMSEIKDGKDADEERIVQDVLSQIKLPEYKETVLDGEKEIKEKILPLDIKDIEGLREELDKIKKRTTTVYAGGGTSPSGGRAVVSYDLSGSLDGATKTFTLPAFWRVISVHSSSFPNAFRATTDYTTDASAMTITFTSEINAATTLATGQTIIVLYNEQ